MGFHERLRDLRDLNGLIGIGMPQTKPPEDPLISVCPFLKSTPGWWLVSTPLKNDGVRQLRDDDIPTQYSWENKIHGNQTTNTMGDFSWDFTND